MTEQKFHDPRERFDTEDYDDVGGSHTDGVHKLWDSSVAPLVAASRGYEVFDSDKEVRAHIRKHHSSLSSGGGSGLKKNLGESAMLIPLYAADGVYNRSSYTPETRPKKRSRQYKPVNPVIDDDGRKRKYVLDRGEFSYLDVHPSTPKSWIENPGRILITEGIIKGDSALTAMLRASGVSDTQLLATGNSDKTLHAIMEDVDPDDRVLIISLIGVNNFKQNPEWNTLRLSEADMWLAFDGDAAQNWMVWQAANSMIHFLTSSKKVDDARLHIVDLSRVETPNGDKVGIDDFLSEYGTWEDLHGLLAPELPEMPPRSKDDEKPGTIRMAEDGSALVQIVADEATGSLREEVLVRIGGRVKNALSARNPTTAERTNWEYDESTQMNDRQVTIEIMWREGSEVDSAPFPDASADVRTSTVVGPANLLGALPDRWPGVSQNVHVGDDVLMHPAWPPDAKYARQWLGAMKSHARDEKSSVVKWSSMGWAPEKGRVGHPQFVLGSGQIINETGEIDDSHGSTSGVDDTTVKDASKYHLDVAKGAIWSDEWNASVKESIERVFDVFIMDNPWAKTPEVGSLVLCAGLRPAMPLSTNSVMFFVGAPKSGKALPLEQEIPVPHSTSTTGFAKVKDISIDDEVYAATDGQATAVRTLSEIHEDEIYEIVLADGRLLEVSSAHIMSVSTAHSRALAARAAGSNAINGHSELIQGLRRGALKIDSGVASEIDVIASRYGLSLVHLSRAVDAAVVPSESMYRPDPFARGQERDVFLIEDLADELAKIETPAVISSETITFDELHRFFGITEVDAEPVKRTHVPLLAATIYPVSETLLALADLLECGGEKPVTLHKNVTAAQLKDMMGEKPQIDRSPKIEGGVLPERAPSFADSMMIAADFAMSVVEGSAEAVPDEVMVAPSGYRTHWMNSLIEHLAESDLGVEISDGNVRIAGIEKVSLRRSLADLARSLGRLCVTFTFGDILISKDIESEEGWVEISTVTATGRRELVRCLSVSHGSGMFLAEDHIPTHNSWSAAQILQFWSDKPSWNSDSLPGSAEDTKAATEIALSKTPLWVIDDLAPSSDSRKADVDQARIQTLVRQVHNHTGQNRATQNMDMRETLTPQALTVVTAENDLSVASSMNRVMSVTFGGNSLNGDLLRVMEHFNSSPHPSRVTSALIQSLSNRAYQDDAESSGDRPKASVSSFWATERTGTSEMIESRLSEDLQNLGETMKRQADITADLLVVLAPLRYLAARVGVDQKYLDRMTMFDDGLGGDVMELSKKSFATSASAKPGKSLLMALRGSLASGRAHLRPLGKPGKMPFESGDVGGKDVSTINETLGWNLSGFEPSGSGAPIGRTFVRGRRPYVLFQYADAFQVAQKNYPEYVPQGQKPRPSWSSLWDEGLAEEPGVRRRSETPTCQIMANGAREAGIPIPLATLLGEPSVDSLDMDEEVVNEDLT